MDIYLTPELKTYYMDDFNNNVLPSKNPTWKICDEIRESIIEINNNNNIQTLYSAYCSNNTTSYIQFSYSHEVELQLFRVVISELSQIFSESYETFYFIFNLQEENSNLQNGNSLLGMGCTDDPNFFLINSIKITFESYDKKRHDRFWEEVKNRLTKID